VKWWLPGFLLIAFSYLFAVILLPRRPIAAFGIAIAFFFSPFFQWWYLSITFWPAVWCLLVMAAAVWLLRSRSWGARIAWGTAVAYVTVTVGMGIYVPFIVAAALVAVAIVAGAVPTRWMSPIAGVGRRLLALLPLAAAGVAGVAVLGVWLLTRLGTIELFLGTVYPGQRLNPTGGTTPLEFLALLGAPMAGALGRTGGAPLGPNMSEASTFFLVGIFLMVPLLWFVVRDRRRRRDTDWMTVLSVAATLVVLAYLLIPGWDAVAHLALLDRTTGGRIRLALGLLSIVGIALLTVRADRLSAEEGRRVPWWPALGGAALFGVSLVALVGSLLMLRSPVLLGLPSWLAISALYAAGLVLYGRGRALPAAALTLAMALLGSATANPVYHGVYDVNETAVVKAMKTREAAHGGRWVGVGGTVLPNVLLVQSGLPSYNGFQSAPSPRMWRQLDPSHAREGVWNRLANVSWWSGQGDPAPINPAPDQIRLTFDSCAPFAQEHVAHVVSDAPLTQSCLTDEQRVTEGPSTLYLYEVVTPSSPER